MAVRGAVTNVLAADRARAHARRRPVGRQRQETGSAAVEDAGAARYPSSLQATS